MSDNYTLDLEQRTVIGKKVSSLRRAGILPATVYGKGVAPISVQLNARAFNEVLRKAGRTSLISLNIAGQKPISAFIHVLQRHPVTRDILHVDFRAVNLTEELTVEVPVHVVGESPLVKRGDALVNVVLNTLQVRALPANLPHSIEVDVSGLDEFDKSIYVRDVVPSGSWTIETDGDELLINLTSATVEEAAEEEADTSAEPELVREKREEDEE